jgi:hypothetical protein
MSRPSLANPCPSTEGAGKAGCVSAPIALRAKIKARKQVTTGSPEHPAFPAQWF